MAAGLCSATYGQSQGHGIACPSSSTQCEDRLRRRHSWMHCSQVFLRGASLVDGVRFASLTDASRSSLAGELASSAVAASRKCHFAPPASFCPAAAAASLAGATGLASPLVCRELACPRVQALTRMVTTRVSNCDEFISRLTRPLCTSPWPSRNRDAIVRHAQRVGRTSRGGKCKRSGSHQLRSPSLRRSTLDLK